MLLCMLRTHSCAAGAAPAGRPVALLQLQDGSLLLSDDYAGAVYRITWSNIPKPPSPVIVPSPPGAKPVPSPPVAGKTVNVNWIYSATAYTPISLNCSDRLMFNWNSGSHNIIFDTTGDCNSMGSTYAGVTTSGAVPWTATSNGKFYFKCTVGDHCVGGNMNLAVTVTGCGAQPPSPPVARSPPPYPYTGEHTASRMLQWACLAGVTAAGCLVMCSAHNHAARVEQLAGRRSLADCVPGALP